MTTHEAYKDVVYAPESKAKYIYLSRNPKDVAVSFYHHIYSYR